MRASLHARTRPSEALPLPLLDPEGARVILGMQPGAAVAPIVPTASSLFGPRSACLAEPAGPLVVCDTGHHRLLLWHQAPGCDAEPADLVIGQPDFSSEGRNAKGEPGAATLNVPAGVAVSGNVLAVADSWNNRVLLWHGLPKRPNQPADVVLGQPDFSSSGEQALKWPSGVALHEGRLYVADTGHRRVLVWESVPAASGKQPDRTLAQDMRWPHAIAATRAAWFVADAGANRVFSNGGAIGDDDLGMPYGVALHAGRLVVADTANSRLLGFELEGGAPRWIAGQRSFGDKGENRWAGAARDSLCWPYGVAACGETLVVADSGNNRVLLWNSP
jgi:hypothetical protein